MLEANIIVSILYAAGFMLFYPHPVSWYMKFAYFKIGVHVTAKNLV